MILGVARSNDR
jgi:hypothetical protein